MTQLKTLVGRFVFLIGKIINLGMIEEIHNAHYFMEY